MRTCGDAVIFLKAECGREAISNQSELYCPYANLWSRGYKSQSEPFGRGICVWVINKAKAGASETLEVASEQGLSMHSFVAVRRTYCIDNRGNFRRVQNPRWGF